jgi:hypothetical protein
VSGGDPAVAPAVSSSDLLRALVGLVERLRRSGAQGRPALYARALPLLRGLVQVGGELTSSRERVALAHEASWHIRCLAGVAEGQPGGQDEHHVRWALESLNRLAAPAA